MPQFVKVKGRVATEHITIGSTGGAQISKLPPKHGQTTYQLLPH